MKKIQWIILVLFLFLGLTACGDKTQYFTDSSQMEAFDGVPSMELTSEESIQLTEFDDGSRLTAYQEDAQAVPSKSKVPVYVCGAVVNPGVYYLEHDAIYQDALDLAGGFLENSAQGYVNLAKSVSSGEKIYFPFLEEVDGLSLIPGNEDSFGDWTDGSVAESGQKMININTADETQLMTLPGIGRSKAQAIISYRQEHGAFSKVEDVKKVTGIKAGTYENIKEFISVN